MLSAKTRKIRDFDRFWSVRNYPLLAVVKASLPLRLSGQRKKNCVVWDMFLCVIASIDPEYRVALKCGMTCADAEVNRCASGFVSRAPKVQRNSPAKRQLIRYAGEPGIPRIHA